MGKPKAVITGATRGIGRAIAFRFASEGFDLAVCARNENRLESLENELKQSFPGISVLSVAADLSQREGNELLAETVIQQWGSIEVLVNNAGKYLGGKVLEEEDGRLEYMMALNVFGPYWLTRALKNHIKPGTGHIFNICSIASLDYYPNGGSYAMTKFALRAFSKSLRQELIGKSIRVTAVMPGAVNTDSWAGSGFPKDRFMQPEDIAEMIFGAWQMPARSVVEELVVRPLKGDL